MLDEIRDKASKIEGVIKDLEGQKTRLSTELAVVKGKAKKLETERAEIKDELASAEVRAELQRVGVVDAGIRERKAIDDELVKLRDREVEITAELPGFDKKLSILAAEFDKVKREIVLAKADKVKVRLAELTRDRWQIREELLKASKRFQEAILAVSGYNERLYDFSSDWAQAIFDATGQRVAYPVEDFLTGVDLPGLAGVVSILGGLRIPADKSWV